LVDNDVHCVLDAHHYLGKRIGKNMERRHFEIIADVLTQMEDREAARAACMEFAKWLPHTNANFDAFRFISACMLSSERLTTSETNWHTLEK
jgi:nucleoside recognition membrane protein YjiH